MGMGVDHTRDDKLPRSINGFGILWCLKVFVNLFDDPIKDENIAVRHSPLCHSQKSAVKRAVGP